MLRIGRVLFAVYLFCNVAIGTGGAHVPLHIGDVVKLRNVAVFLHIWALMFGHGGEQVFNDFVGDEGMSEVEFCDIWLIGC